MSSLFSWFSSGDANEQTLLPITVQNNRNRDDTQQQQEVQEEKQQQQQQQAPHHPRSLTVSIIPPIAADKPNEVDFCSPQTELIILKRASFLHQVPPAAEPSSSSIPSTTTTEGSPAAAAALQRRLSRHELNMTVAPTILVRSAAEAASSPQPKPPEQRPQAQPGWRDEQDPCFVPLTFGAFRKITNRRVCLTQEAAEAERRQREADAVQCHCALNVDGVINCCPLSPSFSTSSSSSSCSPSAGGSQYQYSTAPAEPYAKIKSTLQQTGLLGGSPRLPACRIHDIINALPMRFREIQWRMIFASDVDGFSLGSFYRHVEGSASQGACLMIAEVVESSICSDVASSSSSSSLSLLSSPAAQIAALQDHPQQHETKVQKTHSPSVIGAFLSHSPSLVHGPHHFFGSPETFVFSFDDDYDEGDNNTNDDGDGANGDDVGLASSKSLKENSDLADAHKSGGSGIFSRQRRSSTLHPVRSSSSATATPRQRGHIRVHRHLDSSKKSSKSAAQKNRRNSSVKSPSTQEQPEGAGTGAREDGGEGEEQDPEHDEHLLSSPAKHFIVCSPTSLGIGGGEDGAAIHFVNDLQRGTSSASCTSFGHSPPLVGRARHAGLRHSEFKVHRLYVFALETISNEFIEYLVRPETDDEGDDNKDGDDGRQQKQGQRQQQQQRQKEMSVFSKYPCKGCELEPRLHHKCNFIHDQAVAKKKGF